MAISTYDELKQAVGDWLERNDVSARAEDWISFAERQISRDLRSRKMVKRQFITTVANQRYYPLPSDYLEQRDFHVETGRGVSTLNSATPKAVDGLGLNYASGQPRFYAVHGDEIELLPTPDDEYRIEMTFYQKPRSLSNTNQTNIILTEFPDLLLYASLLNAEAYLMNDQRISLWSDAYKSIIKQENKNSKKGRFGAAPTMTNSSGMVV